MPRKPLNKTTLAELRGIIGMSRADFARLLDTTVNYCTDLELGRAPITEEMGTKISILTGVGLTETDGGKIDIVLENRWGEPYTKEYFEKWRKANERLPEAQKQAFLTVLESVIKAGLYAAREENKEGGVMLKLAKAVRSIFEDELKPNLLQQGLIAAGEPDEVYFDRVPESMKPFSWLIHVKESPSPVFDINTFLNWLEAIPTPPYSITSPQKVTLPDGSTTRQIFIEKSDL